MTTQNSIKKIVVIGPESTGKSTLCEQLAEHFNTVWCPEYARAYLNENGKEYSYDDLLKISEGQLILEDALLENVQNNIYKDILINQKTPWVEISGNYDERLQKAITAVETHLLQQVNLLNNKQNVKVSDTTKVL